MAIIEKHFYRKVGVMTLSTEFLLSIVIQLFAAGIMIGVYKATIGFMQQQISELKEDMRKYNNVLSRLAVAENSLKSLHHRVDEIIDERHNVQM